MMRKSKLERECRDVRIRIEGLNRRIALITDYEEISQLRQEVQNLTVYFKQQMEISRGKAYLTILINLLFGRSF